MKFEDLGLSAQVLKSLYQMGFEEPTPIQVAAIPPALNGRDIIGQAQTGTGKTAAFGIPIVQNIRKGKLPSVLILVPTRELAIQVAEELNRISQYRKLNALPIYGGQSIDRQIRALKRGIDIAVGTPGRIIDHLRRGTLVLDGVKTLILDEADEMLDMGFIEDIETILQKVPSERQTMLFSATITRDVLRISKKYMDSPERISVNVADIVVPQIKQVFYEVWEEEKIDALSRVIDIEDPFRCLIFCHTKKDVDHVAMKLQKMGYNSDAIHGDYTQSRRESVMQKFKKGDIDILVATDVAARGLDIHDVTHVFNYSIPQNPENYIHRIGRTGRAGKSGIAISFVTPKQYRQLRLIEKTAKTRISKAKLPSTQEVLKARQKSILEDLSAAVEDGDYEKFLPFAKKILVYHEPETCLAGLLSISFDDIMDIAEKTEQKGSYMTRLFVTAGRKSGITPKDIVKTIVSGAGVPFQTIGKVSVRDSFTFVEVAREEAGKVIKSLDRYILKGKTIRVEKAHKKKTA
ncbi:DEAD-box ATP-dependent RNA helicase CshA [bacterium BMS3Abin07]|nr:DEAD-box ATP-dependent RNA helicase CshA [bacterium BMS3Abin07]GBE32123.1 DEAD-box ATP-dependent RNA helicase CshA [bacterium BMS3Bbin05]